MQLQMMRGRKPSSSQQGFTLLEMALVLLIWGVVAFFLLNTWKAYNNNKNRQETIEALEISRLASFEYKSTYGRFPCPADSRLDTNDVNYGRENTCLGTRIVAGRDADEDGNPDNVIIGSIPLRDMLDPDGDPATDDGIIDTPLIERLIHDGWGRRLTYAVSAKLTDRITYNEEHGAIDIVDEYNETLLDLAGSAHYALISHGENGRAAYTSSGKLIGDCGSGTVIPAGGGTPPPVVSSLIDEKENCDDDATFLSGLKNDGSSNYNDDIVKYLITSISALWEYTDIDKVKNLNAGFVGIGTKQPRERLQVDGDIRGEEILAETGFCDQAGNDCLPANILGGEHDDMNCKTAGSVVTGINNNQTACNVAFPAPPTFTCPAGEAVISISNINGVKCKPI